MPQQTGVPWKICRCAASFFKVLYVDTKFLPKSRKCCHEIMVNNCCKSRMALQITAREIMTFFWRSASFRAASSDFQRLLPREVVISKKKDHYHFRCRLWCHSTSTGTDCNGWCAAKFVQLISCAGRQSSLGTTGLQFYFFT